MSNEKSWAYFMLYICNSNRLEPEVRFFVTFGHPYTLTTTWQLAQFLSFFLTYCLPFSSGFGRSSRSFAFAFVDFYFSLWFFVIIFYCISVGSDTFYNHRQTSFLIWNLARKKTSRSKQTKIPALFPHEMHETENEPHEAARRTFARFAGSSGSSEG